MAYIKWSESGQGRIWRGVAGQYHQATIANDNVSFFFNLSSSVIYHCPVSESLQTVQRNSCYRKLFSVSQIPVIQGIISHLLIGSSAVTGIKKKMLIWTENIQTELFLQFYFVLINLNLLPSAGKVPSETFRTSSAFITPQDEFLSCGSLAWISTQTLMPVFYFSLSSCCVCAPCFTEGHVALAIFHPHWN